MYISPERLTIQPFALNHRPDTAALGNLLKGLGHIKPRYALSSLQPLRLPLSMHVLQATVVPSEAITALKGVRICSLGSLLALRNSSSKFN